MLKSGRIDADATNLVPRPASERSYNGLRIEVLGGADAGFAATVLGRSAIVGRALGTDVCLSDRTVSAFHVELAAADEGVRVHDLSSRNGTFHGGARIERAIVPSRASLQLGSTLLRVELDAPVGAPLSMKRSFGELRGSSMVMRELFSALERLAGTDLSVLLEGETGTGKEVAARALHEASPRAQHPFVVLDCTAIPANLAESVLFGHERGAFTGAQERRAGVFEAAEGGTVFLDEIGELPLEIQPKLLRVLERREVMRVGGVRAQPVNVRVLSATWRDLRTMINDARFREDLYFRLVQARVTIPALRDRREDIPELVDHFLARLPTSARAARAVDDEARSALFQREYRGNVRELKSVVERAALMSEGTVISTMDLALEHRFSGEGARAPRVEHTSDPPPARRPSSPANEALGRFKEAKRTLIDEFERDYLQRLLARSGNNLSRAGAVAGVDRNYLRDLLRKHGLRTEE